MSSDDKDLKIARLRSGINDLVALLALSGTWFNTQTADIGSTLSEALLATLALDFVYIVLKAGERGLASEFIQVRAELAQNAGLASEARLAIGETASQWPSQSRQRLFGQEMSTAVVRLGLAQDFGFIAAGAACNDFPDQLDKLLLNVAGNQVVLALQEAQLLGKERNRISELDQRIAHIARVLSVGELTASITHEVNQPLSGIIANASTCLRLLAVEPPDIEGATRTAKRTIRDANRASKVIERLRSLFRNSKFTLEAIDLNEVAEEVIALTFQNLQGRGLAIQSRFDLSLPPIRGDRVQLQQVILNLVLNAADAMEGGEAWPRDIVVESGFGPADSGQLTVRDKGRGLRAEDLTKVFEAFYTTKPDGMGIGLSVSKSILDRHNGRLWAEPNDEGQGAAFSFCVPFDEP